MNETERRAPVERDVGRLREVQEYLDAADPDWRRLLRPNLTNDEALLFAIHDIALERRMLANEVLALRARNNALRNLLVAEIRKSEPGGFESATASAEAKVNEYLDAFREAMDRRKKPPNTRLACRAGEET